MEVFEKYGAVKSVLERALKRPRDAFLEVGERSTSERVYRDA